MTIYLPVVGSYRVLRQIGEGGMGTVFEAEQHDPRRHVALKILRPQLALSDEGARLFERETEALARLRHPNIAAIFEAGATDDGSRFFAMELVPGTSLQEWLGSRPLGRDGGKAALRRRIDIFRQICAGVSYAHLRGVIHRDLKPSNIMLCAVEAPSPGGPEFEVKLLDFGLALVKDSEAMGAPTESGVVRGTMAYMSPEQASGNPREIDARTDVYSLGVILYEMTTGRLPRDPSGVSPALVGAYLMSSEPVPPHRAWREQGMPVRDDLEAILLKALALDPDARYQSVAALIQDLDHYEVGLPVSARAPTLSYQLRKLMARHRGAASVAAVIIVIVAGSAIVMAVQRNRALRAEAIARAESEKAGAVVDFVERMLGSASPWGGSRTTTVAEVVDGAAREADVSLARTPGVESAVRVVLAKTLQGLGRNTEAERQLASALAARRRSTDGDTSTLDLLEDLGELRLNQRRYAAADTIVTGVLGARRRMPDTRPLALARTLTILGAVATYEQQPQRADSLYGEALAIRTRLLGRNDIGVAEILHNRGTLRYAENRLAAAESLFRSSLAAYREALGSEHPDVTTVMNSLAMTLKAEGKTDEAGPLYLEALETNRKVLGPNHWRVAQSANNLGMFYYRLGKYDQAERYLREGMALNARILGPDNTEVAAGLSNLGQVARDRGRLDDAERLFRRAMAIEAKAGGEESVPFLSAYRFVGDVQTRAGRYAEAETTFGRIVASQERNRDMDPLELAYTLSAQGELYLRMRRYPEAERVLRRSLPVLRARLGDAAVRTRDARRRLVAVYERWGKPALADSLRRLDSKR